MWRRKNKVERNDKNARAFTELSKAKIQPGTNMVISRNERVGGYTLAQQVVIERERRTLSLFIKGAIHVDSLEGLYELRDALNEAITIEEERSIRKKCE
jgi:hypothetical protein